MQAVNDNVFTFVDKLLAFQKKNKSAWKRGIKEENVENFLCKRRQNNGFHMTKYLATVEVIFKEHIPSLNIETYDRVGDPVTHLTSHFSLTL